jgi:RNA polymerase sigma-70 factor, ECF subfamily
MDAGNKTPPEGVRRPGVEATLIEAAGTPDAMGAEDASLVVETLAGNQASFQLLVERYQERIFSLARHYSRNAVDVEDLVQETFLKAFSRLDTFQRQSSFFTWLYRIAVNTILDGIKRRSRSPVKSVEDPEAVGAPGSASPPGSPRISGPSAGMEREEIARITRGILEEMPEIFRVVLVMREFEDCSYQEMAEVLQISIGTVESRLFRARARFKERLLQKHPEFGLE